MTLCQNEVSGGGGDGVGSHSATGVVVRWGDMSESCVSDECCLLDTRSFGSVVSERVVGGDCLCVRWVGV
jgi:hypothetical protein